MSGGKNHKQHGTSVAELPQFCDYLCKHASFAPSDSVGACRREQAVYCVLLKRYNNKNASCLARK